MSLDREFALPVAVELLQNGGHASQQPQPFVLNMDVDAAPSEPRRQPAAGAAHRPAAAGGMNLMEDMIPSLRDAFHASEGMVPFLLLLAIKLICDHRLDFLVFIALFGTFYHSNSSLKANISRTELKTVLESTGYLAWTVSFLTINIVFIYYVFEEQQLYRSLYFRLPMFVHIDLWQLIWILFVTCYVIKFITIEIKTIILSLPKAVLKYKKKGKYYMLVESVSQLYQSLVPLPPWFAFMYQDESGGFWFASVIILIYTVCKGFHLWQKLTQLMGAFKKFQVDVSYGTVPSPQQLQAQDNLCPICQEKFTDPVLLNCKHAFCEDCVSMWFSRENTCPMCRAKITDSPKWRDGATAHNLFLF